MYQYCQDRERKKERERERERERGRKRERGGREDSIKGKSWSLDARGSKECGI